MNNNNEQDANLIDRYLTGRLDTEETLLFESKMQDPDFKQKVALMNELVEGIKIKAFEDLKASLREEEQLIQAQKKKSYTLRRILIPAAAIALLVVALYWLSQSTSNPPDLFAQYFVPQKNILINVEKGNTTVSPEFEVFQNYENKNYAKALDGFDALLAEDDNPNYRFYQANTLLELNQTEEAIVLLKNLLAENKTRFPTETKWLLALSYLKLDDFASAKPLLQELSSSSFYKEKATQILQDSRFR